MYTKINRNDEKLYIKKKLKKEKKVCDSIIRERRNKYRKTKQEKRIEN